MKRSRGRGRRPQNNQNHNYNNYNHNRALDSAGPDVKIRGTSAHIYEKYLQLARDAGLAGDRVVAESYLQHAEHYYRIMMAAQAQQVAQQQNQQQQPNQLQQQGQPAYQPNGNNGGDQRPPFNQPGQQTPMPTQPGSGPSFGFVDDGDAGDDSDSDELR